MVSEASTDLVVVDDATKTCSKCRREFPATTYYFYRDSTKKDGFEYHCKECKGRRFGETMKMSKRQTIVDGTLTCTGCNQTLPATNYYFFSSRIGTGFMVSCKVCQGYSYGEHNKKSEIKTIDGITYKKCTMCENTYPYNNDYFHYANMKSGKLQSYCKSCGILLRMKNIQTESGKLKHRMKEAKRRAKIKSQEYTLTEDEWMCAIRHWTDENESTHCAYCDGIISNPQQEHVVPASTGGEYTKCNMIPAGGPMECACNQSKNGKDLNEFFELKNSFTSDLYKKIKDYLISNGSTYNFTDV